eukprot:TRINITY_DN2683_c0_g1_i2.p1 TRINITY_DN2683_c0_g1~~TRINITY_DN2683_c0_g1_i2.p1  ORF type:complete len:324 (-),score=43.20 TRINITY_DN2683_c0_g1_i2:25-996(-)
MTSIFHSSIFRHLFVLSTTPSAWLRLNLFLYFFEVGYTAKTSLSNYLDLFCVGILCILVTIHFWISKYYNVHLGRIDLAARAACPLPFLVALWYWDFNVTSLVLWIYTQDVVLHGLAFLSLFHKPALKPTKIVVEDKEETFLEIGSATATMRLLKDLKALKKKNPTELGISVDTYVDQRSGLENLYQWQVQFHFDNSTTIGRDLQSTPDKCVTLEMRFSRDFPHYPPFVRVVRPRFAFHTGHVTIGGSVCMEILTNQGWKSSIDMESVLVQIRDTLLTGGARLERGYRSDYSESEAWEAFYRAAKNHGWSVDGLNPNKFPKIQ